MVSKKQGEFLKKLRLENNLTQTQLSELINYSESNISKWENGTLFPNDPATIIKLAETFNVTPTEIIYGKKNDLNIEKKRRRKENIKFYIITCILMIVIMSFISIYFIFIKNSVKVYSFYGESKNFKVTNGYLLLTNENSFLNFPAIESKNGKEIKEITLYAMKNNTIEKFILTTQNENINIEETLGYKEYELESLKDNDLCISIIYDELEEEILCLNKEEKFVNNKIFAKNVNPISNEDKNNYFPNYNKEYLEFLQSEGFENVGGSYEKRTKICVFSYSLDNGFLVMKKLNNGNEEYQAWFDDKSIAYTLYDESFEINDSYIITWNSSNEKLKNDKAKEDNIIKYLEYLLYNYEKM